MLMWTYQKQYGAIAIAILFIIRLSRAGIENWVKYAILRVSCPYAYAYAYALGLPGFSQKYSFSFTKFLYFPSIN